MTDLAVAAAQAKEKMAQGANPANAVDTPVTERRRIPMTVPVQKLQVPEVPGFFLYWMKGTPERLQQARNAGFDFVAVDEVRLNDVSLGGDGLKSGSTDLGNRVSVLASTTGDGEIGSDGQPLRLYLMKQKWEWHMQDQQTLEDRNQGIAEALTTGYSQGTLGGAAPGESIPDLQARYVDPKRSKIPDMFKRKRPSRA